MPRCQAERNVPGTAGELGGDAKRRAVFQPRRVLRAAVLQLQRGVQSTPIAPGWPAVSLFDPPDKGGGERAFRERGVSDFDFSLIQIKSPAPRPSYIDLEPATAAAKRRKRRNSRPPVGIPDHGSLAAATPRIQLRPARRTPVTGKPRPRPRAGPFICAGASLGPSASQPVVLLRIPPCLLHRILPHVLHHLRLRRLQQIHP